MTIVMPEIAKVSIFTDNDLTHITDDHFEIKLIARLLDQIYVVQPPMLPPRYDDAPPGEYYFRLYLLLLYHYTLRFPGYGNIMPIPHTSF